MKILFQDIDIPTNPLTKSQLQTNMNKRPSKADMKGKGKALAVQPKEIRKASAKISDKYVGMHLDRDNISLGYVASRSSFSYQITS